MTTMEGHDINDNYITTPAEDAALSEAGWYILERANDLCDAFEDLDRNTLVSSHLFDVAAFLADMAAGDTLEEGDDDDPALVSAKRIAAETSPDEWPAVVTALKALSIRFWHLSRV